jgi:hypothetical protein
MLKVIVSPVNSPDVNSRVEQFVAGIESRFHEKATIKVDPDHDSSIEVLSQTPYPAHPEHFQAAIWEIASDSGVDLDSVHTDQTLCAGDEE